MATLLVISCRYPVAQSWQRAMTLLQQARDLTGDDFATRLHDLEQNGFRWALLLQPKNPHVSCQILPRMPVVRLIHSKLSRRPSQTTRCISSASTSTSIRCALLLLESRVSLALLVSLPLLAGGAPLSPRTGPGPNQRPLRHELPASAS
jgi:hypothetical protein